MLTQWTTNQRNHFFAVGYMLIAVTCISLTPLWMALSQGGDTPFLFNAALRLDVAIVFAIYLWASYRHFLFDPEVMSLLKKQIFSWLLFFTILGSFDFALFAWASRFIDISIAAILFELWAIFIIFFMHWLYRRELIYQRIDKITVVLLLFGFIGVVFVISSQSGKLDYFPLGSFPAFMFGVVLAILGAVISAFAAFNFRWSTNVAIALTESPKQRDIQSFSLFAALIGYALGSVVAAPTSFVIGTLSGEVTSLRSIVIVLGGAVAQSTGSILWRKSNLLSNRPSINAIAYGIPILSLGWLALFSFVGVPRPDYLIIGAAAIVTANLLINFEADIRAGFKILVVSLWSCGAFVYLRDDFLTWLPFDTWLWTGAPYIEAMTLSATVFILLLSFRVVRLVSRTRDEDNRTFLLFQNLDLLVRRDLIDGSIREHVLDIDGSRSPEQLQEAYQEAKLCFARAIAANPEPDDHVKLSEAEAQLNALTYSRQQGIDFGELFALITFGAITVVLALASRLHVSGWTAVLVELFTMLFSAVIIFLVSNVWDLQRDRAGRILQKMPNSDGYGVVFRDVQSRRFEQGTSIVVGLAVTAAYFGLFWYKWLG